jgi:transposase-like protein
MEEQQGRWSTKKKAEVVPRLLRGEAIDSVSRECSVTVETLNRWREEFIEGGIVGLKGQTVTEVRVAALEKKIGQQAMEIELYKKKRQWMENKRRGNTSKP